MTLIDQLKYNADGLIPAIIQDVNNGDVLMLAWMNKEALRRTMETKKVTYWSRSRQQYWVKGETSGNTQELKTISFDCDEDCLLLKVEQVGAACHNNYRSCFYRDIEDDAEVTNATELLEGR
jgi:phosphoribosyl-AMP cyclohydrolase